MSLNKPGWLESWLSHLNWDILNWHIYVGDAIESAIDWVLDWIDDLATWAAQIAAWWEDFRQEVIDAFNAVVDFINEGIGNLGNIVSTWWDNLSEWWEGIKTTVLDWIDTAVEWVSDRIDDLAHLVDKIGIWWENFTTVVLPTLASKFDITAAFDQFMLTWRDLFEGWEAFKDSIFDFFNDPLDWLWDRFTDWWLGPEE